MNARVGEHFVKEVEPPQGDGMLSCAVVAAVCRPSSAFINLGGCVTLPVVGTIVEEFRCERQLGVWFVSEMPRNARLGVDGFDRS